ncbi:hypothetical protein [Actinoplanes sp. NPDC049265]|uniref:hypothetical protein n=1 Tax=Actinoplanes sp. NPDC049265 TaxID=3363902 RepID=UPI003718CD55
MPLRRFTAAARHGVRAPVRATLDAAGRLTRMELDMPAMYPIPPAQTWTLEFSAYGAAKPATAPPAGQIGS